MTAPIEVHAAFEKWFFAQGYGTTGSPMYAMAWLEAWGEAEKREKHLRDVIAQAQNKAHILKYTKGAVSKQCQVDCDKLFVLLTKALAYPSE